MKSLLLFILVGLISLHIHAQGVGINNSGNPPHPGAALDVMSSDKGVLLPRTQASSITNPTAGMVIYDTEVQGFRYYNGTTWKTLLEEGTYSFWWADQDGDGYGNPFNVIYAPEPPEFYVDNNEDCNDLDASINPSSPEICDGIDNNCNGMVDEGNPGGGAICGSPIGTCQQGVLTCIDGQLVCFGEIGPEAEVCDGQDNDCNGETDEAGGDPYWIDADGDTFGDVNASPVYSCTPLLGYANNNFDCDDSNAAINPAAQEVCNMVDDNCDGVIDESCLGGNTCCGASCVDTQSDISNCGGCGLVCNDGLSCTTDQCISGTCFFTIQAGMCVIDGVCYNDGESSPGNECLICDPNFSQTSWAFAPAETPCGGGMCDGGGVCE